MKTCRLNQAIATGILILLSGVALQATVLVSYDAAAAGAGVTPTGVIPAWSFSGGGNPEMANNGSYLLQDFPVVGSYGEYRSPGAGAGTMLSGVSDYGIQFAIQPLTDVPFVGSEWANLYLGWADDAFFYNVTIDKYSGASTGGTGDIVYGQGSFSPAITGIDWSVSHTIYIGVRGSAGASGIYDFYLDGIIQSSIVQGSIARSRAGWESLTDRVVFGDGTSAGTNVQAEWYNVSITDSATPIPEPAALGLVGFISLLGLLRGALMKVAGGSCSRFNQRFLRLGCVRGFAGRA